MNWKIKVERRADDWKAYLAHNSACWGCGKNVLEAIGDLIMTHGEKIEVVVTVNTERA